MKYEFQNESGRICCECNNPEYLCDKCKAKLAAGANSNARAASFRTSERKTEAEWRAHFAALLGVGSLVLDAPADPYAAATASAPYAPEPDDYPGYDPYGTPPDIYLLALAAQDDTPDTHAPHPTDDRAYQPHGTAPDGYAIALDAMKEN